MTAPQSVVKLTLDDSNCVLVNLHGEYCKPEDGSLKFRILCNLFGIRSVVYVCLIHDGNLMCRSNTNIMDA